MEKGNLPHLLVVYGEEDRMAATVMSVEPGSYAELHGITPGCTLLKLNGHEIVDVLDYRFYMTERVLKVAFKTPDGLIKLVKIEKDDEYDDLGIEFETYLIDKQHSSTRRQFPENL